MGGYCFARRESCVSSIGAAFRIVSRRRRRTREAPDDHLEQRGRFGASQTVERRGFVHRFVDDGACRVARRRGSADRVRNGAQRLPTRSDCGRCRWDRNVKLGHCTGQAYCGNGMCDAGETCESCPGDCGCGRAMRRCGVLHTELRGCERLRGTCRGGCGAGHSASRQVRGERLLRKRCVHKPHGQGGLQHVLGGLRLQAGDKA